MQATLEVHWYVEKHKCKGRGTGKALSLEADERLKDEHHHEVDEHEVNTFELMK